MPASIGTIELIVLQRTHMPAALLEAGSIINRHEEPVLANPERRAVTSAAITAAVEDFCTARATRHDERLAKRPSAPAVAALPHRAAALPSLASAQGGIRPDEFTLGRFGCAGTQAR